MADATHLAQALAAARSTGLIGRAIELARDEDLAGSTDVTSVACVPEAAVGEARLRTREPGVLAGLAFVGDVLDALAPGVAAKVLASDGGVIEPGQTLAVLRGPLRAMLAGERTLLNLLSRLSGIATLTARFVERTAGTRAVICDTRKTTPGLRTFEKYAVVCGGGVAHRRGLFDAVLIKDNHLAHVRPDELTRFVAAAVDRARQAARESQRHLAFVEVEADSLAQHAALLTLPPGTIDIILLDNMSPGQLREAVAMRDAAGSAVALEASGGVTLDTASLIAATGVDRISVGALTHHAVSLDLGLDIGPG